MVLMVMCITLSRLAVDTSSGVTECVRWIPRLHSENSDGNRCRGVESGVEEDGISDERNGWNGEGDSRCDVGEEEFDSDRISMAMGLSSMGAEKVW